MTQFDRRSTAGLSRRTFLRGTALAAATSPLIAGACRINPPNEDPDVLKVGLVGCGGRGTGAALQAMLAEPGTVILSAVADVFPDRIAPCLETLALELGPERAARLRVTPETTFVGFDAYRELIEQVDVVILATPPYFRPVHLAAVAAAGKHCFCEKPVAVDAPGVRSVLASAQVFRDKRLSLASGFCWRANAGNRELYERVLEGQIGTVQAVYSTYLTGPIGPKGRRERESDFEYQVRNWYPHLWLSGDHIVEQAVHSIDKQQWAFNDALPISAVGVGGRAARGSGPEEGNIWDHFSIAYEYSDGRRAFHFCRQIAGASGDNTDHIYGTEGRAIVEGWTPNYELVGKSPWFYEGEGNDMYQQEHDDLFASIRAATPLDHGEWMAHSTLVAIQGRMAAYTGQVITWEQALESQQVLGPATFEPRDLPLDPPAVPGKTPYV
jgi:myo-inositol 2-dehydrogenase / D-chiro-inositol 1-dehydrogenase